MKKFIFLFLSAIFLILISSNAPATDKTTKILTKGYLLLNYIDFCQTMHFQSIENEKNLFVKEMLKNKPLFTTLKLGGSYLIYRKINNMNPQRAREMAFFAFLFQTGIVIHNMKYVGIKINF